MTWQRFLKCRAEISNNLNCLHLSAQHSISMGVEGCSKTTTTLKTLVATPVHECSVDFHVSPGLWQISYRRMTPVNKSWKSSNQHLYRYSGLISRDSSMTPREGLGRTAWSQELQRFGNKRWTVMLITQGTDYEALTSFWASSQGKSKLRRNEMELLVWAKNFKGWGVQLLLPYEILKSLIQNPDSSGPSMQPQRHSSPRGWHDWLLPTPLGCS